MSFSRAACHVSSDILKRDGLQIVDADCSVTLGGWAPHGPGSPAPKTRHNTP